MLQASTPQKKKVHSLNPDPNNLHRPPQLQLYQPTAQGT